MIDEACYLVALLEEEKRGADRVSSLLARYGSSLKPQAQRWRERLREIAASTGAQDCGPG